MMKKNSSTKTLSSHDIQQSPGFLLAKITKLKRRIIDAHLKELGLSRTQWITLIWLKVLGPCSQKELLHHLDIDAAHLARVLEQFENHHYIVRTPIKGNRRALFIELTPLAHKKLMPQIDAAIQMETNFLTSDLSTRDIQSLQILLEKMAATLEAELNPKDQKE